MRPPRPRPGSSARSGLRSALCWLPVLALLAAPAGAVTGPAAENPESTVRLISPWAAAPAEGELWLGLDFTTAPGWHVYWKNSGDAGYPPAVSFGETPEISGAELTWPAPERYELPGGLVAFGYEREAVYPVRARIAAAGRERIEIVADLDYLVCEVDCVPYSYRLTLDQPLAAPGTTPVEDPATAPRLAAWRDRLPAPPEALGVETRAAIDVSDPARPVLEVAVDGAAAAEAEAPKLFLEVHELFTAGAPIRERGARGVSFRVPLEWREIPEALPASAELAWTVTGLGTGGTQLGGAPGEAGSAEGGDPQTAAIETRRTVPVGAGPPVAAAIPAASPWLASPAAAALGAVLLLAAALAGWGLLPLPGPARAGTPEPGSHEHGPARLAGALGFAALAGVVGLLYRLSLLLPAAELAAIELALLALALAAWARRRAGRPLVRAASAAAMLLAAAAAVAFAAGAGRDPISEEALPQRTATTTTGGIER